MLFTRNNVYLQKSDKIVADQRSHGIKPLLVDTFVGEEIDVDRIVPADRFSRKNSDSGSFFSGIFIEKIEIRRRADQYDDVRGFDDTAGKFSVKFHLKKTFEHFICSRFFFVIMLTQNNKFLHSESKNMKWSKFPWIKCISLLFNISFKFVIQSFERKRHYVVSLGGFCNVKWRIKRLVETSQSKDKKIKFLNVKSQASRCIWLYLSVIHSHMPAKTVPLFSHFPKTGTGFRMCLSS